MLRIKIDHINFVSLNLVTYKNWPYKKWPYEKCNWSILLAADSKPAVGELLLALHWPAPIAWADGLKQTSHFIFIFYFFASRVYFGGLVSPLLRFYCIFHYIIHLNTWMDTHSSVEVDAIYYRAGRIIILSTEEKRSAAWH